MIKKGLFFFALIAVLLAALHTTYGTPDIASYAVVSSGAPKLFNDLSFATNKAGTVATWGFKPTEAVSITTNHGFQTQFPKFVDFSDATTIKLYKAGTALSITFTIATSPQTSRSSLVRCLFFKPSAAFTFDKNVTYRFEFTGCAHRERPELPGNCGSSFVKLADAGDIFSSVIGNLFTLTTNILTNPLAPVHACDSRSCCGDARLSLFLNNRLIEDGAPDTCFIGDIDRSNITNAPAETTTLSSLEITTTNHICRKKADVTFTFYTATKLLGIGNPSGINGKPVPGYLWFYLPLHRGTEHDVNAANDEVIQTQLSFELSHTVGGVTKVHNTYIGSDESPKLVVRRLSTSSQYGIVVQIALSFDIPPSAHITAKVIGVINPAYPANSCGAYGRYSSSDSCCSPHHVQYKHGNSAIQDTKAISLTSTRCPNYFNTEEALLTTGASKEIWRDVKFSPDFDLNEDDSLDDAFLSLTVSAEASAYNEYTVNLPGFRHKNYDNCPVSTKYSRGDGARDVLLTDIAIYENNVLRTPSHVHVIQSEFDVKFRFFGLTFESNASIQFVFPRLKATSKLPRRNQCNLGIGNANRDFKCCRDFSLTIAVTNGNVEAQYVHSQSCPILSGSRPIDCTNAATFTPGQCCSDSQIAFLRGYSTEQYKKCQEYRCANPRSDLFDADLCCSHERFNNNEKCCSNGWFCPQTCCLNSGKYFHAPMCCKLKPNTSGNLRTDYQFQSDIVNDNLPAICKCHKAADASEWDEFAQQDCCAILDNVTDQTTSITHTLPKVCHCQELFNALAALNPTNPLAPTSAEIDQQNIVINKWIKDHPSFTPEYCCQFSTNNNAITNTQYFTKWCTCSAGQLPWSLDCCEYDSFTAWCPIQCTAPTDGCGCGCGCNNGNGGCCDNQRVDINDVTSGDNTIITIASNKKRHNRRANVDNEL